MKERIQTIKTIAGEAYKAFKEEYHWQMLVRAGGGEGYYSGIPWEVVGYTVAGLGAAAIAAKNALEVVPEGVKGVRIRLGRTAGEVEPGLRLRFPVIDRFAHVSIRPVQVDVRSQEGRELHSVTADGAGVTTDATVILRVSERRGAATEVIRTVALKPTVNIGEEPRIIGTAGEFAEVYAQQVIPQANLGQLTDPKTYKQLNGLFKDNLQRLMGETFNNAIEVVDAGLRVTFDPDVVEAMNERVSAPLIAEGHRELRDRLKGDYATAVNAMAARDVAREKGHTTVFSVGGEKGGVDAASGGVLGGMEQMRHELKQMKDEIRGRE